MLLNNYYSKQDARINISREQASNFAKKIANDFNPIHDVDSKNFCVPGDLLFALVLAEYGLTKKISFSFVGMVNDETKLIFPENPGEEFSITDDNDKEYLKVERPGYDKNEINNDKNSILQLIENYVAFSGKNFPDLLVPLMAEHNVMINQRRPMIIYQSMSIELESLDMVDPSLELSETSLNVQGKKGFAQLNFFIHSAGKTIGTGVKNLGLRGLLEYEQKSVDAMVEIYHQRKIKLS
jgi:hypothetical protein